MHMDEAIKDLAVADCIGTGEGVTNVSKPLIHLGAFAGGVLILFFTRDAGRSPSTNVVASD